MTGNSADAQPPAIRGWMAFSAPNFNKTTASARPLSQDDSGSPNTATQHEQDMALFSDPAKITGELLLDLAERWSDTNIARNATEASSSQTITRPTIVGRMGTAVMKRAKALGKEPHEIRESLTERRKANGVRCTRRVRYDASNKDGVVDDSDEEAELVVASMPNLNGTADSSGKIDSIGIDGTGCDASNPMQQNTDNALFADQDTLRGEKLLLVAERYSNAEISARICAFANNFKLSQSGVASRVHVALENKAAASGIDLKQARQDLNNARSANYMPQGKKRRLSKSDSTKTDTQMTKDDGNIDAPRTLLALVDEDSDNEEVAPMLEKAHMGGTLLPERSTQFAEILYDTSKYKEETATAIALFRNSEGHRVYNFLFAAGSPWVILGGERYFG
jgi:hypothetical protein